MIHQPSIQLRIKLARCLNIGVGTIKRCEEWTNCLFVIIERNGKKISRFMSKNILRVNNLPLQNGLVKVNLSNGQGWRLVHAETIDFCNGRELTLRDPNTWKVLYLIDIVGNKPVKGWDNLDDCPMSRQALREIEFQSYSLWRKPLQGSSGRYAGQKGLIA